MASNEKNPEKRMRKLTDKAKQNYDEKLEQLQTKLITYRKEIEETIILFKTTENIDKKHTLELQTKLNSCYGMYQSFMEELRKYLYEVYTEESLNEHERQNTIHRTVSEKVVNTIFEMENLLKDVKMRPPSVVDSKRSSRSSRSSQSATLLAEQKAKLKAAKLKLVFERKQEDLKKEKDKIDSQMNILNREKDVAVENVILETLEEELKSQNESEGESVTPVKYNFVQTPNPKFPVQDSKFDMFSLDPNAEPFKPEIPKQLSTYLLKRDLLVERFFHFDDKPESYNVWKTSFRSILDELKVSPVEEFDLLQKYLGSESKSVCIRIRQSNALDTKRALELTWERLEERYGSPELIEQSLKKRIQQFPYVNKDNSALYRLSDLCNEIESTKKDPRYAQLLSYFDSSTGVHPIMEKLPIHLQSKWVSRASHYKKINNVYFPPFSEFCSFLKEMSVMMNDPGLCMQFPSAIKNEKRISAQQSSKARTRVSVNKIVTDVFVADSCPIHGNTKSHSLNDCKTFKGKSVTERKHYLKDKNICYKCCNSTSHAFKTCTFTGRCMECGSDRHPSGLHYFQPSRDQTQHQSATGNFPRNLPVINHGREQPTTVGHLIHPDHSLETVNGKCTSVCGDGFTGKSCSKTILVKVHPVNDPNNVKLVYCIIDDQSNRTLCKTELFQMFDTDSLSVGEEDYDLVSCSGRTMCSGRTLSGLTVMSLDNSYRITLPTVLECDNIPNSLLEIPTPEISKYHTHLRDIPIPPLQENVNIVLLIGRDLPEVHHVLEQCVSIDRANAPFAQRLSLGWVIIGEVCLNAHKPNVKVMKTYIHKDGRPSLFQPCESKITVRTRNPDQVEADVFVQTDHDNKIGLSIEDKEFLDIMDSEFYKDETGHWSAPLPFRSPRPRLQNNKKEAYRRAMTFENSLKRDSMKLQLSLDFMGNLIDKGYCELASQLEAEVECWYLPLFGVYHPKKRDKIRIVFDSSSKFKDVSLNSVLMSGPDLTNNLTGILLRFRKERVAIMGDIEQMFYQFRVNKEHRDYLRFLWYQDNDFSKPLVEYRMCVHVFGNAPSPAVATYGLRRTALNAVKAYGEEMLDFVNNDFYVDDGLTSQASEEDAVLLISGTQKALLEEGKLRFHKLVSNSSQVLESFDKEDLGKGLKLEDSPVQRSLGLNWSLDQDCFMFHLDRVEKRSYTKRSVLATINSLYDPLGFLSPFTITGKILLRDIICNVSDWDEPLPEHLANKWVGWIGSLPDLELLKIPRVYFPDMNFNYDSKLHVFCDASEKAIASVAYLVAEGTNGPKSVAYVFGKTKVAPKHGHTIPRLELCAAVLGVEIAETVSRELSFPQDNITYHSDSKVVLGYLNNRTRRFYVYVENRVSRILKFSKSSQWKYIETSINPADEGTRGMKLSELAHSSWLSGHTLLDIPDTSSEQYELLFPDKDAEVRDSVKSVKTEIRLGTHRFRKFSRWKMLLLAFSTLIHFIRRVNTKSVSYCETPEMSKGRAEQFVIKQVQSEAFSRELQCLKENKNLPKDSHVLNLSPFLDENGLLRVGGRLRYSQLEKQEKHPILIPGKSHIAMLIIHHYHERIHHQGRHITEGAVRTAGFWITGGRRLITNHIFNCVTCRKLRGQFSKTKMADLPVDRITPAPPFTFVGVDVFGPWNVVTRRTKRGSASSKRWAVIFTCLTIRAIHIEVIDEMSTSAFINALQRFVSIRGKVKIYRSDRGTNFVGATDDLDIQAINVEDKKVNTFLYDSGSTWIFNPPHASHMGGVWERMIGVTRRILDAILLENKYRQLTHDVLSTFMAEVCAIVNSRPITPVSTDPEDPLVLTPSVLLTHKTVDSAVSTFQHLDIKDMYRAQWKCVQVLAEVFWKRWRSQYLVQLQSRKIWNNHSKNVKEGDYVLLRDKSVTRNDWPVGLVTNIYPSEDGVVRKCSVKILKDGKAKEYIRPIVELVKLIE